MSKQLTDSESKRDTPRNVAPPPEPFSREFFWAMHNDFLRSLAAYTRAPTPEHKLNLELVTSTCVDQMNKFMETLSNA